MLNPFLKEEDMCFACVCKGDKYKCAVLEINECPGYNCSTYKTWAEVKEQKEKCKNRIMNEISEDRRKFVLSKYGTYR